MKRKIRVSRHAVQRALDVSREAAAVGFDWETAADVVDKLDEEVAEIRAALEHPLYDGHLDDEIGDLFFALVNFARKARISPERAFSRGVGKFERRFRALEKMARQLGLPMGSLDAQTLDALWRRVKKEEKLP